MRHRIAGVACGIALVVGGAAEGATARGEVSRLHRAVSRQRITIERLERLVEQQGKMLERLESRLPSAVSTSVSTAVTAAVSTAVPPAAAAAVEAEIEKMKGAEGPKSMKMRYGSSSMEGESRDGNYRIFVGGRLHLDAAGVHAADTVERGTGGVGPVQDGVGARRARLDMGGSLFKNTEFYLQFDLVNAFNTERAGAPLVANVPAPTDLWMQFKGLPVVRTLRVGNQKPPVSFEHLTSSRFLDFMERSSSSDAFIEDQDNGFRPGLQIFDDRKERHHTWALGVFKHNRNPFYHNSGDGELDLTGRFTWTPWYEDGGRRLLHLGIAGSHRDLDDGQARFRTRTLVRNGSGATHTLLADVRLSGHRQNLVVPEIVAVSGPLTLQTEFFANEVTDARFPAAGNGRRVGDIHFDGYYAQVLWFLTGEHKNYDRRKAAFSRVIPRRNAAWGPGAEPRARPGGAWMLAYRHGEVDLNDGLVLGGQVHDDTVGLNWFLNPTTKIQWNYTKSYRDAAGTTSDGTVHSYGTGLRFDF